MSSTGGVLTPHAELERRYRRLLRLYPREFRARRTDEMIGVLMASAADGRSRPARGDVSDIVKGSALARLRGPRGGWTFALSAFALVAPLFLVLTDILQVAFPYSESQAAVQSNIGVLDAHGVPGRPGALWAGLTQSALVPQHDGGIQLLSQPAFLILAAGHLCVAVAVVAGLRRTALVALVIAAVVNYTRWMAWDVPRPGVGMISFLTIGVFLLEAIALAAADPRVARRREGWLYLVAGLALAVAAQLLALSFDATRIELGNGGELHAASGNTTLVIGYVLALLAVLLPLPLGLGWRASLPLAATFYPLVMLAATASGPFGRMPQTLGITGRTPAPEAHLIILTIVYLPPLLLLCLAVTRTIRARRARGGSDLAA
ncbi:MAG: hypothetical protein ACRDNS_14185 [Trebonia sp.]